MIKISIRKRKSTTKRYVYLSLAFNPSIKDPVSGKIIKSEPLHLYLYQDPENEAERSHNAEILYLAECRKSQRTIELAKNEFNIYDRKRLDKSFLDYFEKRFGNRNSTWNMSLRRFSDYMHGHCTFGDLSVEVCQGYMNYLMNDAVEYQTLYNRNKRRAHICQNTASKHYNQFRTVVRTAYEEKYLPENINIHLQNIPHQKTQRFFLTQKEIVRLYNTPCRYDGLRNASMFAIFTGLRKQDILNLTWDHIITGPDGRPCIRKVIEKTGIESTIFISDDALFFCGPRTTGYVFKNFSESMTHSPLKKWIQDSGIEKPITFHCFRHTNASLMLANGVDLYTISQQLCHSDIKTTQIYLHMYDPSARRAADTITLESIFGEESPEK